MPTAEIDGRALYYEEHGEGEPLLCVHGLTVNTLGWALQLPAFAAAHRTLIFDNRDVGRSWMADDHYEIADMAADALALADHAGLDRFHLLGISMGGAIAQELLLAAPERVLSATLAVTFPAGGAWARALSRSWGARRQKQTLEEHVDELLLLNLSEQFYENEGAVEYLRAMMLADPHPQPPDAFARQLDASSRHDARDRLGAVDAPVQVVGAEHDLLVPVWKSRELAELIPGSRLTVMERAPHGASLERAEEFNRLVLDFAAEQSALSRS
jgi:pimeloyl-ACP methyl ester carboxylesterase